RHLGRERVRIGLVELRAVARGDAVLVARAGPDAGRAALPDPRRLARAQLGDAALPVVPVADHGHALRVGGPHRGRGGLAGDVRAQPLVGAEVRALVEAVELAGSADVGAASRL